MADSTDALIAARRSTHGDWQQQSGTEQQLKWVMRGAPNWHRLTAAQKSALEMLAVKQSRILCGNPDEPDHWADIAGYARLGGQGHDGAPAPAAEAVADPIKDWAGHT